MALAPIKRWRKSKFKQSLSHSADLCLEARFVDETRIGMRPGCSWVDVSESDLYTHFYTQNLSCILYRNCIQPRGSSCNPSSLVAVHLGHANSGPCSAEVAPPGQSNDSFGPPLTNEGSLWKTNMDPGNHWFVEENSPPVPF